MTKAERTWAICVLRNNGNEESKRVAERRLTYQNWSCIKIHFILWQFKGLHVERLLTYAKNTGHALKKDN